MARDPEPPRSQPKVVPGRSKVVARPVPKAQSEDPREFQLGQMQRRFNPERTEQGDTILSFEMVPSDPDFPYDIESLECVMSVPATYPRDGLPTLKISNKDIPRGFQINIERGFATIVAAFPEATLLGLMNRLDKQLETILAGEVTETVKIVANVGQPKRDTVPEEQQEQRATATHTRQSQTSEMTDEKKAAARSKRVSDIRQLEARFSRLQSFAKSADGSRFTLPLDSPKRPTWPAMLQSLRTAEIFVPESYPFAPLELHLGCDGPEARNVEAEFKKHSAANPQATITQQFNHLTQNLKDMSMARSKDEQIQPKDQTIHAQPSEATKQEQPPSEGKSSHIHYIPRPPEWSRSPNLGDASDSDDTASTFDDEAYSDREHEREDEAAAQSQEHASSAPLERGILLSFPHLELHGIELLELTSLNITVKCERCKDLMDVERIRSSAENSAARETSCKKCANSLAIRFRADMIHANSVRAGYLDLDGCTVVDMLPSQFVPTCSECSTAYPAPGVSAVRGDSAMAICRECHKRMSLRIQEVKFLQVSAAAIRASAAPGRKKTRENLGITVGTELPGQGKCSHYRKSYRWFRFSCCGKVFACDRCHDEQTDHPNEFANRMLCGFCSREQSYRPEDCGICHAALTGKKGRGFWEGGKGTRDPMRMSRKDPRKYKRRPGMKPKT